MQRLVLASVCLVLLTLTLSGCFEDKVKVDMASYAAIFTPKFKDIKASMSKEISNDEAARSSSNKSDAATLRNYSNELHNIKPKTPEVQEVHAKICRVISASADMAEIVSSIPAEPDAVSLGRIAKIQADGERVVKEIGTLLRKISTEHKSQEALQLLQDLEFEQPKR